MWELSPFQVSIDKVVVCSRKDGLHRFRFGLFPTTMCQDTLVDGICGDLNPWFLGILGVNEKPPQLTTNPNH